MDLIEKDGFHLDNTVEELTQAEKTTDEDEDSYTRTEEETPEEINTEEAKPSALADFIKRSKER